MKSKKTVKYFVSFMLALMMVVTDGSMLTLADEIMAPENSQIEIVSNSVSESSLPEAAEATSTVSADSTIEGNSFRTEASLIDNSVAENDNAADSTSLGGNFAAGNYLCYPEIDFTDGQYAEMMLMLSAPEGEGKIIDVYVDGVNENAGGTKIGSFSLKSTQNETTFLEQYAEIRSVEGVHNLYLVFPDAVTAHLDWFTFSTYAGEETEEEKEARMQWWNDARFGQFIHFGAYSQLEGEYKGQVMNANAEWIMGNLHIPKEEYANNAAKPFNPTEFDTEEIVTLAKNAGQKYIVFTSKHHEGFSMYDTQVKGFRDYKITSYGDYKGEDPVKALAEECRNQGIHFGVYFTIMEWHDATQEITTGDSYQPTITDKEDFKSRMKGQLRELVEDYGVEILFFDGEWVNWWTQQDGDELYRYLRTLKPDLIINNRVGKRGEEDGDYGTPEQTIPATGVDYDWESCMTLNNTWGFNRADTNWKSPNTVISNLVDCASKGGNYLLNVGPDHLGQIPEATTDILTTVGEWLNTYGDSIYGTDSSCFESLPNGCKATVKDGKIYLHVFDWTVGKTITLPGIENEISSVKVMGTDTEVHYTVLKNGMNITLPNIEANAYDTVIEMDIDGYPAVVPDEGNLCLEASDVKASAVYSNDYPGFYAIDGKEDTRWATPSGMTSATLEVIFEEPVTANQFYMHRFQAASNPNVNKIYEYQIEYWEDGEWKAAYSGTDAEEQETEYFEEVTSDRFRLNIIRGTEPTIYEFQLRYDEPVPEMAVTSPSETMISRMPLTISGTAKNTDEVEVVLWGVDFAPIIHTTAVQDDGTWALDVDENVSGDIVVYVRARDEYGTLAAEISQSMTIRPHGWGVNLAKDKEVEISSSYSEGYEGNKAVDGDTNTRWSPEDADTDPWMAVNFGEDTTFNKLVLSEMFDTWYNPNDYRCRKFQIEAWDGENWQVIHEGTTIGEELSVDLEEPVTASEVRLRIMENRVVEAEGEIPANILEFEVYNTSPEQQKYEITVTQSEGGTITPGTIQIEEGDSQTFAITPDRGYEISDVLVDGQSVGVRGEYTFENISEAHTLSAVFTLESGENPGSGQVSKKTLEYFLNEAKGYVEDGTIGGLVESIQKMFEDAIAKGEAVMADENAAREDVLDAAADLMFAIHAQEMKAADKTDLEMALELARMIDLSKYVEAGQAEFLAAKEAAEAVMTDGDAMQAETDEAWNNLVEAMNALRLKADKSVLEDLINQTEGLDLTGYTEESVSVFRAALTAANEVLADETLSVDDQDKVGEAVSALQAAYDGLEKVQGGDSENPGNQSGNNGQNGNGSQSSDSAQKGAKGSAVQTGDSQNIWIPIVGVGIAVIAAAVVVTASYRRKKK